MNRATDVVVIGSGLSGLAAAAYLGRAGRRVTVLEKASEPGGRAATHCKQGFSLNLGAHALYRKGAGMRVLDELGVEARGNPPAASAGYVVMKGALHTMPMGFVSLVSTGLFGLGAKLELSRVMSSLASLDPAPLARVPLRAWLEDTFRAPEARRFVEALFRLSTYAADFDRMSAGAAIAQHQIALAGGVLYLDGGWQSLVDGLRYAATSAGAAVVTGAKAARVEVERGAVQGVTLEDGTRLACEAVIIAASPGAAKTLVPGDATLAAYAADAVPIEAACLDVALRRLPREKALFAIGADRPVYFSVHSKAARLAPEGGAVIHLVHYQPSDPRADEAELEALLDLMQPGSRDLVVERRFLPSLTVNHKLVTAREGGLAGRPDARVPSVEGLYLAGDWVGPEGMLADASLASAKRAAALAGAHRAARAAA